MKISMSTFSDQQTSALEYWHDLRNYFIDRVLIGFMILAVFGLPISMSRSYFYGWQPIYALQITIAISIVFLYSFRFKLNFSFKTISLSICILALSLGGLGSFGLAGGGVTLLLLLQFLVATVCHPKVALPFFLLIFLTLMFIGLGFIFGYVEVGIDLDDYVTNISAWSTIWITFGVISMVAFRAMGIVQHTLLSLLQELEQQRDQISYLANHDQLTGLPTMRLAQDRLEMAIHQAERHQKRVAILFIDLDGFKQINDTFGHDYGDHVLKVVAQRMSRVIRAEDTVARRSGDEFLIILGNIHEAEHAAAIATRVIREISQPVPMDTNPLQLGASVGISLFPDHGSHPEQLKQLADEVMYKVKRTQKNNFAFAKDTPHF